MTYLLSQMNYLQMACICIPVNNGEKIISKRMVIAN